MRLFGCSCCKADPCTSDNHCSVLQCLPLKAACLQAKRFPRECAHRISYSFGQTMPHVYAEPNKKEALSRVCAFLDIFG